MKHIWAISAAILLTGCDARQDIAAPTGVTDAAENVVAEADVPIVATKNAYFGDLHIHTKNSFDAYIFGTRATPDDAYAFARGEAIDNGAGQSIALSGPPLDFLAVTDHGEYLGIVPEMARRGSELSKTETAKSIFGLLATNRRDNFLRVGQTVVTGEEITDIYDRDHMDSIWAETVASAQRHYRPGKLTTFAGYEYTAMAQITEFGAANLHRNVIFKNEAPDRLFTTLDSPNPEDLWDWMDGQRAQGRELLAIPHNSNASNGLMFARTTYDGAAMTEGYAEQRLLNEPIVEITQVKGTSEAHPALSPNDEWADFEQYENLIGSTDKSQVVSGSFVRNAIASGFSLPGNPYRVGVIGSSDTHVAAGAFSEEDFFGKFSHDMDNEARRSVPDDPDKGWPDDLNEADDLISTPQYGASGLAGVWAEANTRPAIFDAMRRRETFATSGPRIRVRFFAGDFETGELSAPDFLERAYASGAPMGSELTGERADAVTNFAAIAYADPDGEPLERLQIIKVRADGTEHIYDAACAGGAPINPATHRCELPQGALDLTTCEASGAGSATLQTIWSDPDGSSGQNGSGDLAAAYYVRALERPKCRWSSWDAARAGTLPHPTRAKSVQDRAWSSAIWFKSGNR